mmetsp:Transcript_150601/g.419786  ORF Transcript_150601/g.419786 Transcript_150601/m.419786 type:complete len:133 (-) Transcript_150601:334-732(-)
MRPSRLLAAPPPPAVPGLEVPQVRQEKLRANWWSPHLGQFQSPGRNPLPLSLSPPPRLRGDAERDLDLERDLDGAALPGAAPTAPGDAAAVAAVGIAPGNLSSGSRVNSTMPSPTGRRTRSRGDAEVGSSMW